MTNWNVLKTAIVSVIKTNGNQEITGQLLQNVLNNIITSVGENATFAGIANLGTNPGTPDGPVFYIATNPGVYPNFSGLAVQTGKVAIFKWSDGTWTIQDTGLASEKGLIEAEIIIDKKIRDAEQLFNDKLNSLDNVVQSTLSYTTDLSITDDKGNSVLDIEEGHLRTKNFNSDALQLKMSYTSDLSITDDKGNSVLDIENGHIKTKNFDSSKSQGAIHTLELELPKNYINIYTVCNDLDKSNKWGIGSRNYSNSIYLDHLFITSKEQNLKFSDNESHYYTISQSIEGTGTVWNKNLNTYEQLKNLQLNNGQTLNIKIRTTLNSATQNNFPKVLQIGDSVTEGWFSNYPIIDGAPAQSFAWAKYYFEKDKEQANGNFKSLFVGHKTKSTFNYNNVQSEAFACGYGGTDATWYNNNVESPFYNPSTSKFSLSYYLNKYKTLADDGITRLIPGVSAGSEVSNSEAYDLCTPNIVVLQLGMNGTFDGWKTDIQQIINSIKNEYPNMAIIVSILSAAVCNYPSLYPNWQDIYFHDYANAKACLLECFKYATDNIQNESDGIFVVNTGLVEPMPYSCNVRELISEMPKIDESQIKYIGVDAIERVKHPSRYAHQAIGYQLYSAIKFISSTYTK